MPRTVDWRQWTVCRTCACNLNRIALSIMCSYWTCQTIQTAISQVLFSGCPRWILWQQNNCWMRQKLHQKDSGHCPVFIDWGLGRLKIKNPTNSLSVDADKWTTISYISWKEKWLGYGNLLTTNFHYSKDGDKWGVKTVIGVVEKSSQCIRAKDR